MGYVPSENDDLSVITAAARSAITEIFNSQSGYFTGQYWLLGKCLLAAMAKFGAQKAMYRKWRDQFDIPIWTLSHAKLIAECAKYPTQEDAAKDAVQIAFQKSKKKNPTDTAKAGKIDIKDCLWAVKQKMKDVEKQLPYENDDDAFVHHYYRLQELKELVTMLVNRHFGRFDRLTTNNKKGAA